MTQLVEYGEQYQRGAFNLFTAALCSLRTYQYLNETSQAH